MNDAEKLEAINEFLEKANMICITHEECDNCPIKPFLCTGLDHVTQEHYNAVMNYTWPVDWSKVPIDTPVWCWEANRKCAVKKHFAGLDKDGMKTAFTNGMTSWTGRDYKVTVWRNMELAFPGEV